jgi:hypothetical protein
MPTVSQQNIPTQLDINTFNSAINNAGQFAKGCRFLAVIQPPNTIGNMPSDLHLMCEAVELPGRGFNVTETRYYGPSMSFPNNTMYNTANMSFLCRTNSPERFFFDEWMEYINPTSTFNFAYPQDYWARILIYQFSEYGKENPGSSGKKMNPTEKLIPKAIYGWTLHKAWPTLVNPQQMSWADNDILRLQVTFSYKYWDRPQVSK